MSERQGVEIDYCPNCRGVWLDRGELDKILDKAIANEKGSNFQQQAPPTQYKDYKQHGSSDYKHHKKHWLSDLFD